MRYRTQGNWILTALAVALLLIGLAVTKELLLADRVSNIIIYFGIIYWPIALLIWFASQYLIEDFYVSYTRYVPDGYFAVLKDEEGLVDRAVETGYHRVYRDGGIIFFTKGPIEMLCSVPISSAITSQSERSFKVIFGLKIVWQYPRSETTSKLTNLIDLFPKGDFYSRDDNQEKRPSFKYLAPSLPIALGQFKKLDWQQLYDNSHVGKMLLLPEETRAVLRAAGISVEIKIVSLQASEELRAYLESKKIITDKAGLEAHDVEQKRIVDVARAQASAEIARVKAEHQSNLAELEAKTNLTVARLTEEIEQLKRAGRLETLLNEVRALEAREKAYTNEGTRRSMTASFGKTLAYLLVRQQEFPTEILRVFFQELATSSSNRQLTEAVQKMVRSLPETTQSEEEEEGGSDDDEEG